MHTKGSECEEKLMMESVDDKERNTGKDTGLFTTIFHMTLSKFSVPPCINSVKFHVYLLNTPKKHQYQQTEWSLPNAADTGDQEVLGESG